MQLTLQSRNAGDVIVVRCRGRIVSGEETQFLQRDMQKLTEMNKKVVMQLAEVNFIDSGGLGALVRLRGVLRAARGDLKLCQLSPFVTQVLKATNLLSVFHPYASEKEAIESYSARTQEAVETFQPSSNRIVCLDSSPDLLAYVKVLLQRLGYQVFTTQFPSDAVTWVSGARSSLVVFGPGMRGNEAALAKFRQKAPNVQILQLPPDFSTSEADQTGAELLNRVRSLLAPSGI
ncbi:MAG: anti-sigma factor antagonist [Candidatus Acidiferrales bacterium]